MYNYQRLSYGGTDLTEEQQQTFLANIQRGLANYDVYAYKETDVDPEGAAECKNQLQLFDVLVEVPLGLLDWLNKISLHSPILA